MARYFFGDGQPEYGTTDQARISATIMNRKAVDNPITCISCYEDDTQVEWMKQLEEKAPYVSEYHDYIAERAEIQRDQGLGMPFTYGCYLVGQIVKMYKD